MKIISKIKVLHAVAYEMCIRDSVYSLTIQLYSCLTWTVMQLKFLSCKYFAKKVYCLSVVIV